VYLKPQRLTSSGSFCFWATVPRYISPVNLMEKFETRQNKEETKRSKNALEELNGIIEAAPLASSA